MNAHDNTNTRWRTRIVAHISQRKLFVIGMEEKSGQVYKMMKGKGKISTDVTFEFQAWRSRNWRALWVPGFRLWECSLQSKNKPTTGGVLWCCSGSPGTCSTWEHINGLWRHVWTTEGLWGVSPGENSRMRAWVEGKAAITSQRYLQIKSEAWVLSF